MAYDDPFAEYDSETDWKRARRKALYQDVVCHFKTCSVDLLSFEKVRADLHLMQKLDRGVREIPLDHIRGSVGRYDDFTAAFLPRNANLEERWKQVDVAMRKGQVPPIEVYQVGDAYFVLDGNHRVSIANQQGLKKIDAYVSEYVLQSPLDPDADINAILLDNEHRAFLKRFSAARPEVLALEVTSPDKYEDVTEMIDQYRVQVDENGEPLTLEQAASAWYEDAYAPARDKIRKAGLLERFPGRTETDLFVWAWRNNSDLEDMAAAEGFERP
jgi:uncharacterized ParB-like nuclease family protein